VWLNEIQVMAARRRAGSAEGLYLAAQGGHNAESHNHNDVGNFIVYADGQPAIVDVGVETYTARTFSAERYQIWTMQSAYHNVPTIDRIMQRAGREFEAREIRYRADDRSAEFALDIARAYPAEAGLRSWLRTLRLDRAANTIDLVDSFALEKRADQITQTLMTPIRPAPRGPGLLVLDEKEFTSGPLRIEFDPEVFGFEVEEIPLRDPRLNAVWGDRLHRILLKAAQPPTRATWSVRFRQG
jgi:hypothetical protein